MNIKNTNKLKNKKVLVLMLKSIRINIIMSEENISQEKRLKNIYETRNYLIEGINQNQLMSKNQKKVYRVLNYT